MTAPRYLVDELHRHGVHEFEVRHGGKHPKLRFRWNGRVLLFVFASSPSDKYRGARNERASLRRLMRTS